MKMLPIVMAKKKEMFIKAFTEKGTIYAAAEVAELSRDTVSRWRKDDPDFAAAMDRALEDYADKLEREADRRGCEGFEEPVFFQGKEVAKVRKFSDNLLMFKLKGLRPEKYRETVKIDAPTTLIAIFSQGLAARYALPETQGSLKLIDATTPEEEE